ncbi:glycosyltransferase family 2 protein [Chryseobacterium luteum]|uniref:glycosyltransferase family 2 protein n=1 Tax=Chryseobacterium luteum TaxID=421531 RepID=UPI0006900A57|nr:glycosyltransferase family A protein [Chryseobacterium luteum]
MLAVIVPYYKKSFFSETLKSIEAQTDKRFNVYIGNDASPEDPEDLINQILKNTSYTYFPYKENLGGKNLALQWERVIGEAKNEEWIMILGDDDILENNVVEMFYKNLETIQDNKISLVKFSQYIIDENGSQTRKPTHMEDIVSSKDFLIKKISSQFPNSLSENIFSKEIYLKYRFKKFPLAWHSDDLAILEFSDLKDFLFIHDAKVGVRISSESISGMDNTTRDKQLATYLFCEHIIKNYGKIFPEDFIELLLKKYREIIWRNGFDINIDFSKIILAKEIFSGHSMPLK